MPVARYSVCEIVESLGTDGSNYQVLSMRSSAGCRYNAGVSGWRIGPNRGTTSVAVYRVVRYPPFEKCARSGL